jgi:pimeloyl-ACP methyl ester carboxylesterase
MPEFIEDLKIVPLQDMGHWVLLEATGQVNTEVLAFLDVKGGGGLMTESIASVRL